MPETCAFGFTGLLLWLFCVSGVTAAIGQHAWLLWIPLCLGGILLNLQVKHLGSCWPDVAGGTPNYTFRLLQDRPWLGRYAVAAYFQGWASPPALSGMLLADLTVKTLELGGLSIPGWPLRIAFTAVAFAVAFRGTKMLSVLHLFFAIPSIGVLLLLVVQGMEWMVAAPASPGFAPGAGAGVSWLVLAQWFIVGTWAAYGCETASSLVSESQKPRATLRAISAAACLIPIVYLGGSWVIM
ncbi:MAG: hypothetical protein LC627_01805, partial [Verrucomicrobiaceae bacterium]|nr:hypothetical protein [Verrucomicrobiaceae bacterium]